VEPVVEAKAAKHATVGAKVAEPDEAKVAEPVEATDAGTVEAEAAC
jgi:hypothetical protein